jgi:trans-aconitate methyltransferase
MPTSYPAFHDQIAKWIEAHPFKSYLDLGAGDGKYGQWVRQFVPGAAIDAIEIDRSYIDLYKLRDIYDNVYCADIVTWFDDKPDYTVNVVFFGDGLEHLKKSDGLDLVHYLMYRASYIHLTFPWKYLQGAWYGHEHEAHRSCWTERDFEMFEHEYKSLEHDGVIDSWCILKGWR